MPGTELSTHSVSNRTFQENRQKPDDTKILIAIAARPHWYEIFKGLKENNSQLRIVNQAKLFFRNVGEMMVFWGSGGNKS